MLEGRITDLAKDVGRLSRRAEPGSSLEHQADRLAGHVQSLYLIVTPTAGELVARYAPGDDACVVEALRVVDERWFVLQGLLNRRVS